MLASVASHCRSAASCQTRYTVFGAVALEAAVPRDRPVAPACQVCRGEFAAFEGAQCVPFRNAHFLCSLCFGARLTGLPHAAVQS
jgi:hypothetical protein